jgi:hypothetical protein
MLRRKYCKLIKLYTYKCFSRYPQFQIAELVGNDKKATVTNNSTTFGNRGSNGRQQWKGKGKGNHSHQQSRHQDAKGKGKGKSFQRPNNKGKGKGNRQGQGNRQKPKDSCAYCHKDGHEARECRKRLYDEKQGKKKPEQNNHSQHLTQVDDETAAMFHNHATFHHATDEGPLFESDQHNENKNQDTVYGDDRQEDNEQQPNDNAVF